jgi:anti-sigma-K factor RskA
MSARMDHERIEELLAARALGGLDPSDERALAGLRADHGDCALCEAFETEYGDVAGRLAFALQPLPLREGFEDEVVSALGSVASLDERRSRGGAVPARRNLVKGWVAAVAAVFMLLAGSIGGYLLGHQTATPVVATFEGPGSGTLAATFVPGSDETLLVGAGLEAPPEGQTYELWVISDGTPVPGGTFEPSDGQVVVRLPADPSDADLMAVTIEVDGGVDAPTGEILYSAEV